MNSGSPSRSRRAALMVLLVAFVATLINASPASAHESESDPIGLVVNERRIVVTAPVPFTELGLIDTSGDGLLDADELSSQEADIASTVVQTVRDNVQLTIDGTPVEIIGAGVSGISAPADTGQTDVSNDDPSAFVALAFATGPHDGEVGDVKLEWAFDSPHTEVVLAYPDGVIAGELSDDRTVDFTLDAWSSATSFFALGIEHIQFGPDHLLFLLVLTLTVAGTAVTSSSVWRTVKLVTAFTIGHGISLGLAYFDLVSVPASIVEPAISLSIVAAAILAVRGRATEARPWIATAIGVIHGLGFASSLASMGVATSQRASALAAFNLGIDIAQTAVVLGILGVLWIAGKVLAARINWVTIPAAVSAGIVGLAWTTTRLAGI